MERETEILKLVNVLRKTSRMAQQAAWAGNDETSAALSVDQYNRVLKRLSELDEHVAIVFSTPGGRYVAFGRSNGLPATLSNILKMKSKGSGSWGKIYGAAFDSDSFKDFWRQSAKEIEDLGEFIRENIEAWAKQRRKKEEAAEE